MRPFRLSPPPWHYTICVVLSAIFELDDRFPPTTDFRQCFDLTNKQGEERRPDPGVRPAVPLRQDVPHDWGPRDGVWERGDAGAVWDRRLPARYILPESLAL